MFAPIAPHLVQTNLTPLHQKGARAVGPGRLHCSLLANEPDLAGEIDAVDDVLEGLGRSGELALLGLVQRHGDAADNAVAIAKLFDSMGAGEIIMCDRKGIICAGDDLTPAKAEIAAFTNKNHRTGTLADAMKGADIFVGVSAPGIVTSEMAESMAENAIIMAMANPVPEIMPDLAKAAGAAVVGTGRSDFPNQINNVLAFPGIFRGALDVRASDINEQMKIAAAKAIASLVSDGELNPDYILPAAFDERVGRTVAEAVAQAARDSGVARI